MNKCVYIFFTIERKFCWIKSSFQIHSIHVALGNFKYLNWLYISIWNIWIVDRIVCKKGRICLIIFYSFFISSKENFRSGKSINSGIKSCSCFHSNGNRLSTIYHNNNFCFFIFAKIIFMKATVKLPSGDFRSWFSDFRLNLFAEDLKFIHNN